MQPSNTNTLLVIVSLILGIWTPPGVTADGHWCYRDSECLPGETPAKDWGMDCKSGSSQSPIDIVTSKAKSIETDIKIELKPGYHEEQKDFIILNNGHTVQLNLNETQVAVGLMKFDELGEYTLAQLHFHWGSDNSQGSEHQVNGKKYPMEVHFVHFQNSLNNLSSAVKSGKKDALLVLGVFFEISGSDNAAFAPIADFLKKNPLTRAAPEMKPFTTDLNLGKLLPNDLKKFFRYSGSLTTPMCLEVVQWVVLKTPVQISESQMGVFRSIVRPDKETKVTNNYRDAQPLNNRDIFSYGGVAGRLGNIYSNLIALAFLVSALAPKILL